MEKLDIRQEFMNIAGDSGVLGDSDGSPAYGYARVSTAHQAEEGASGLPRQLRHIHEAALRAQLYIPYELLHVDDGYTGFQFVDRPALTRLRYEFRGNTQSKHLVVEEIDRLSRNADWHQGYLLDEFARRHVVVHFYNDPGSELERYIRGYMAQEAMRKEIERMHMGKIYKAMDGRVTATQAAYGYDISDPKNSHYILKEDEARIVKMVFDWLTEERRTLYWAADQLNQMGVPGRRDGKWSAATLLNMVKNEVYKGWYITNRKTYEIAGHDEDGKPIRKWRTRPEEEWIWVEVPAIVSVEQWAQAREVLKDNRNYSDRNAGSHTNWLLSGLIECGICQYVYRAARGGTSIKGKAGKIRYYHCGGRWSAKAKALGIACDSPYVHAEVLENAVWAQIETLILDPKQVIPVLENEFLSNRLEERYGQLQYLSSQLGRLQKEKARWDAAYAQEVLDLNEYTEKVGGIKERLASLKEQQHQLEGEYKRLQQQTDLKGEIEVRLEGLRDGISADLPHEVKRKIITTLIEKIVFNAKTGEGRIIGAIPAVRFELHSGRKSRLRGSCRSS